MAGPQKKAGEDNWFYHTPFTRPGSEKEPECQPISQIPGLSDLAENDDAANRKYLFRDTDSDYVRLAKMGGRSDLLRFRDPPNLENDAKPYPRVEWFDHERELPNGDSEDKKSYYVPDYMIHEEHQGDENDQSEMRTRPYRRYKDPVNHPVNRDIESERPAGIASNQPQKGPEPRTPKVTSDRVDISKLLSFGYQNEWLSQRGETVQGDKDRKAYLESRRVEYRPSWQEDIDTTDGQGDRRQNSGQTQQRPGRKQQTQPIGMVKKTRATAQDPPVEKPMFKMSRFQNVPAKVDTYNTKLH